MIRAKTTLRLAFVLAGLAMLAQTTTGLAQGRRGGFGGFGGGGFGGGGPGGFGGGDRSVFEILRSDSYRDELKISDDQRTKIDEVEKEISAQRPDFRSLFGPGTSEEDRAARMDEMRKKSEELRKVAETRVQGILSSTQFTRYRQLALQRVGTAALSRDDIADQLKLTEKQREDLKRVSEEQSQKRQQSFVPGQRPSREDFEKLNNERDAALLSVLGEDQRKQWDTLRGPPPASANGEAPGAPAPTTASSGSSNSTRQRPRRIEDSKPPEGSNPVVDFDARPQATPTTQFGASDKKVALLEPDQSKTGEKPLKADEGPTGDKSKSGEERRVSFNFKFAPWEQVLKKFAEIAGLTLEMDEVPPGTFNYYDDETYSAAEALDILNGYLLQKGFLLVRRDRFLVVLNYDYGVPPNLVPTVPLSDLPKRGRNELMTVILPLTSIDIKAAEESVKELVGPQGKVVPLPKVQRLMVTDIGSNLRRIHEVLAGLGAVDSPDERIFKQFRLKNISATEADRTVRELFGITANSLRGSSSRSSSSSGYSGYRGDYRGGSDGRGGDYRGGDYRGGDYRGGDSRDGYRGPDGSRFPPQSTSAQRERIQLAVDGRTNSLLVTATVQDMALVEQTITTIDVSQAASRGAGQNANESQLKVYALESVDPRVVVDTLNAVIPGLTIIEDTRADHVHVYAPPFEQEMVARMIKEMDKPEMENGVLVVQLRRQDPVATAATLKGLFAGERRESAPSVEADTIGRRLLIRGTPEQIAQIQKLLEGLGEGGINGNVASTGSEQRGTVRMLSPGSHSSQELVTLIERLWGGESGKRNPIRIVVPSDLANPTVRKRLLNDSARPDVETVPQRLPESSSRSGGTPRSESSKRGDVPPAAQPVRTSAPSALRQQRQSPLSSTDSKLVVRPSLDGSAADNADDEQDEEVTNDNAITQSEDAPPKEGVNQQSISTTEQEQNSVRPVAAETARDLPEVRISTFGGRIVVSSDDTKALDDIEHLVETLTQVGSSRARWTLFYLRTADATETATMLGSLFPAGSVTQTADSGSGMFGSFGRSFSSFGSSVMSATGLNSLGGSQPLRIIPDVRANALFVSGSEDQIEEITDVLRILDASDLPENLRDRVPGMIPVEYADVEEVAAIVRDVYKEQIEGSNPFGQGGSRGSSRDGSRDGSSGFNPLAMLMGGANGGRGQQRIQMSIGVDTRTNTLVVSASDSLFRQVESLVKSLDQSAYEAKRTVRVVELSNSAVVTQALSSLLGKVKVSTTGSSSRSSGSSSDGRPPFSGFGGPPFGSSGFGGSSDDFRRMMEFRARMSGGSSGFSPFGSRSDSGRSDSGRGDSGRGDSGRGDFGRGDFGRGDFGRGFGGGFGSPRGDSGRSDRDRGR